jgi:hypothetical protein
MTQQDATAAVEAADLGFIKDACGRWAAGVAPALVEGAAAFLEFLARDLAANPPTAYSLEANSLIRRDGTHLPLPKMSGSGSLPRPVPVGVGPACGQAPPFSPRAVWPHTTSVFGPS